MTNSRRDNLGGPTGDVTSISPIRPTSTTMAGPLPRPQRGTAPESKGPGSSVDHEAAALGLLLRIEALARDATGLPELVQAAANETRKINRARQIFIVEVSPRGSVSVAAVSGVSAPDRHAPLVASVARLVEALGRERRLEEPTDFTLPAYCDATSDLAATYPFREMAWVPLADRRQRVFGGLLMAREAIWTNADREISVRLARTYAHAWRELETAARFRPRRLSRSAAPYAAAAMLLAMLIPVPMTALAPAEIVARNPMIVAAPIDGVIDAIAYEPGATVKPGDLLVRMSDTVLRNRHQVAQQEVSVAETKVRQATILALADARSRHELGIAQAELTLKRAEAAFASDMLQRSEIRAQRGGLVVYPDRRSLIGKPVSTGERIMEIADPAEVEVRIDLALADAIALKSDSRVKLFLDVAPLEPLSGRVVRSGYRARPSDGDVLSFQTYAALDAGAASPPRIGLRGTAQVTGDWTALGILLFRRPISSARQWLGF